MDKDMTVLGKEVGVFQFSEEQPHFVRQGHHFSISFIRKLPLD